MQILQGLIGQSFKINLWDKSHTKFAKLKYFKISGNGYIKKITVILADPFKFIYSYKKYLFYCYKILIYPLKILHEKYSTANNKHYRRYI